MTPIDRMDPEAYPWPKRFKTSSVNLRRWYHSYYAAAVSVNFATHVLFNGSTGERVIVVRGLSWAGFTVASPQYFFTQQGSLGTHLGAEQGAWLGEHAPSGQHLYLDANPATTPNLFITATATVVSLFTAGPPLYVLPPGWSVAVQQNTKILTTTVSWFWEELRINDPMLGAIGEMG